MPIKLWFLPTCFLLLSVSSAYACGPCASRNDFGLCQPNFPCSGGPRIPSAAEIFDEIKKASEAAKNEAEKIGGAATKEVAALGGVVTYSAQVLGESSLKTFSNAVNDTVNVLQQAAGDTITTAQKAAGDSIKTVHNAGRDLVATYVKAWSDASEQSKRSFDDAVDAGQATVRFTERQLKGQEDALKNAAKRVREGKAIDAMWGLATEPPQTTEQNFAKATQESAVINSAAQAAAATYGGPAGASAYAAWSTYRATGDADLALRAGILSAVMSQTGGSIGDMPSGTAGEALKKAALAGAAGGIAVAAAGGDEKAITDGFLRSGGAVLVQSGTQKLKAYSPKAYDAAEAVQCISSRDVDCLSNTTYARDAVGKVRYDENGKPRIDEAKLNPKNHIGEWSSLDPQSPAGKVNEFIADISKLPQRQVIPVMNNQWVITWTLGKEKELPANQPTVVLTEVGGSPPFIYKAQYQAGSGNFSCPFNGFNRTVKTTVSNRGCKTLYRNESQTQVIWNSEHDTVRCYAEADNFALEDLRRLGISCNQQ